jgi:hypothetical protein
MTDLIPAAISETQDDLDLVPARRFVIVEPVARFGLTPGDRILVAPGDQVTPGLGLAEHPRDPRVDDGPPVAAPDERDRPPLRAGDWWPGDGHEAGGPLRRRQPRSPAGELLHPAGGRWLIATGAHLDRVETPVAGTVVEAIPGREVTVRLLGRGLDGALAAGIPARGRLERVTVETGLRGAIDVGRAGTILVVDGRIDSEAVIRARATGVRGVVASGLSGKDLRDLQASEARQRASLQPLAPFAVLVLDGAVRRPIPGPIAALLAALEGREVAIVVDPPMLVFDPPQPEPAPVPRDWVRVLAGELAGREGRWLRSVGPRRFAAGVHLEAASIALDDGRVTIVPLADLERFI